MKLAILSGASPERFKKGAVIRLPAGSWRFHVHGLEDSIFAMDVEGHPHNPVTIKDHQEISFVYAANVSPMFLDAKNEKSITVIAERINVNDPKHS